MKSPFKYLTIILIVISIFYSCISSKKYAEYIDMKPSDYDSTLVYNDFIILDTSAFDTINNFTNTEKTKSLLVPAIIYWQWNTTIECDLNQKQTIKSFNNYLHSYADSLDLSNKLDEQKVIIKIESIPASYTYTNKGFIAYLLLIYMFRAEESITPSNDSLIVLYDIYNNEEITNSGRVEISNIDLPMFNLKKSTKKFTWQYLEQYDLTLKVFARNTIIGILDDL